MKKTRYTLLAAFLLCFAGLQAQTQDELMAKAMAANVVGKEHDILKQMEGKWSERTWYQMAPDQPAMEITGTAEVEMILGGRFAELEGEASAMGYDSERLSIIGHDNRRGVYTINAFDTHGTYGISAEGKYDPATKAITFNGVENDPIMPHPMKFRIVMRFPDTDTIESEIWFLTDEKGGPMEQKVVWTVAKRENKEEKKKGKEK